VRSRKPKKYPNFEAFRLRSRSQTKTLLTFTTKNKYNFSETNKATTQYNQIVASSLTKLNSMLK